MAAMRRTAIILIMLGVVAAADAQTECACDPAQPDTMKLRQCSLCSEAEKQPADLEVFYLKDINPRKPNRWLALPRQHHGGLHHLHDMPATARTALWTAAIERSKALWGDDWGVAYNGEKVRTQCHTHLHIGKMMTHVENDKFIVVSKPSQIPAPAGEGLWIHGAPGNKMHVHLGEQTTETVLMR
jgi:diadenosine tetraphosphate (Ap4A) HIT family hydrolase